MSREEQFDFYWKEIFDGLAYNPIEFNTYRFDQSMSLPSKFNKLYEMFKQLALNNQEVMVYLKEFVETFDFKLETSIKDILLVWLDEGLLADVVREAINDEVVIARGEELTLGGRLDKQDNEILELKKSEEKLNRLIIDPTTFGLKINGDYSVNRLAILNAISIAKVGETVKIPAGTYGVDDTVLIDKDINFIMDGDIVYHGERDRPCLHFRRPRNVTIKLNGEVRDKDMYTFHGWENDNYVGVVFENAFRSRITVNVIRNFTVGLQCLASGGQNLGFFFNNFSIYQLIDNRIQFENKMKDPNSWFNANIFTDIFFSYTQSGTPFQTANVDRFGIKQTHVNNTIAPDTNIFRNIRFDLQTTMGGTYTGIYLTRAWEWLFEKYRSELVSNSNVKFAVLNAETNQIRGLTFDPLVEFYKVPENIMVDLINVSNPNLNYLEIYKKMGSNGNLSMNEIFKEDKLNLKYRSNANDYHFIKTLYRLPLNITTVSTENEVSTDYSTQNRLIENGVEVGSSFPVVLYLKNIKKGDTVEVTALKSGDVLKQPVIRIKPLINNTVVDDNQLIEESRLTKTIVSSNSYWDTVNKILTQSVSRNIFTFSINSDEVDTVIIYVYGGLNGISIKSNNNNNTILKSLNQVKNNSSEHYLSSIPIKKIEGHFKPFEVIYTTGGNSGWYLDVNDSVLEWKTF